MTTTRFRIKLLISMTCLVVFPIFLVMMVVEYRERKAIEGQVQKRGLTIAGNLAAFSADGLLTYNYVILERHAERLARHEDVMYVIILDWEGRVVAHSRQRDLQGKRLTDSIDLQAAAALEPLIQVGVDPRGLHGREKIVEVAIPVFLTGVEDKGGTVRVGISLQGMHKEIQRTRLTIATIGGTTALLGFLAAQILARRLTAPLEHLGVR